LTADEVNIIGSLEWMQEHVAGELDEDRLIARICNGMRNFWRNTGRTRAGLTYLPWGIEAAERVVAQTEDTSDQRLMASVADNYGDILRVSGRLRDAEEVFQR
jgi:hypothetical protein